LFTNQAQAFSPAPLATGRKMILRDSQIILRIGLIYLPALEKILISENHLRRQASKKSLINGDDRLRTFVSVNWFSEEDILRGLSPLIDDFQRQTF
jgi:hypothetical protein